MNTTSDLSPVLAIAAYVEGRRDGFKAGLAFGIGAVVVARMIANRRVRKAERTRVIFGRS